MPGWEGTSIKMQFRLYNPSLGNIAYQGEKTPILPRHFTLRNDDLVKLKDFNSPTLYFGKSKLFDYSHASLWEALQ